MHIIFFLAIRPLSYRLFSPSVHLSTSNLQYLYIHSSVQSSAHFLSPIYRLLIFCQPLHPFFHVTVLMLPSHPSLNRLFIPLFISLSIPFFHPSIFPPIAVHHPSLIYSIIEFFLIFHPSLHPFIHPTVCLSVSTYLKAISSSLHLFLLPLYQPSYSSQLNRVPIFLPNQLSTCFIILPTIHPFIYPTLHLFSPSYCQSFHRFLQPSIARQYLHLEHSFSEYDDQIGPGNTSINCAPCTAYTRKTQCSIIASGQHACALTS